MTSSFKSYRELYPEFSLDKCYFFFDEIQNIKGWERFIRRIYDSISKKIFITGSNSRLLGEEIATSLRGRTIRFEVFPLIFREFIRFKNFDFDPERDFFSSEKKARLMKREISGLREACRYFNLKKGYIITYDNKGEVKENGINILIFPAYELLLTADWLT